MKETIARVAALAGLVILTAIWAAILISHEAGEACSHDDIYWYCGAAKTPF